MSEMTGIETVKDGGRVPVYILLDTSGSMAENIDALKTGLINIRTQLQSGPVAEQVAICVAEYNSDVRVLIPLARPKHMEGGNIEITAGGVTLTGNALKKVNEMSRQDLHFKTENDYRADKKPVLIILTDGAATDECGQIGERAKQLLQEGINSLGKWWGGIMACGMGNYNREELIQITGSESNVVEVRNIGEFFNQAMKTISSTTQAAGKTKNRNAEGGGREYDPAIQDANSDSDNLDF